MATHQKVAVVTGAGTGIGKAAAVALLHNGYRVAFAGRRREPLAEAIAQAGSLAANALAVPTDVADPASVAGLFEKVKAEWALICTAHNLTKLARPA